MEFDYRSLFGGRQFLVNIELARNGNYIKTSAHINGGANIFGAISTSLASQLLSLFRISFLTLPKPIVPTGYDGHSGKPITSAVLLTLTIDKRRINFPFLVTDLGGTDILIGRNFLEHYSLKLDYAGEKNRIHWPDEMPVIAYYDRRLLLCIDKTPRKTNAEHQADVPDETAR